MKLKSMNPILKLAAHIFLIGTMIFASCKKQKMQILPHKSPIANAGSDQTFFQVPDSIVLDGSSSADANGRIISYQWTKISGTASTFDIVNSSAARTVVKNASAGFYQLELKVTDNFGLFSRDTMQIVIDTLRGDEVLFSQLTWEVDADIGIVYAQTPERHDLFFSSSRNVLVSIEPDSTNLWIIASDNTNKYPGGYFYYINSSASQLFVYPTQVWPDVNHLAGRKVSVKVKFF